MQVEGSDGYAVKLLQPAFGITPERFNAIDVMLTPGKLIRTMIHPKMFIKTNIHQAVKPRQPSEWITVSGAI